VVTGGDGTDPFKVQGLEDPSGPTEITDFDAATEQLVLDLAAIYETAPGSGTFNVTTQDATDGSGLEVLVNNTVVAKLTGVTTATPPTIVAQLAS